MKYSTIRNDRVGIKADTAEAHHDHVRCPDFTDLILPPSSRYITPRGQVICRKYTYRMQSSTDMGLIKPSTWIGNGHDGDQYQDRE
jgi:hypothetical protein